MWQAFGAAIALPLYYYHHLAWFAKSASQPLRQVPLTAACAIPFSFGFGAVLPAVIGMLPLWVDRSPITHENILAVWQLDPLWVSAIQWTVTFALSKPFCLRQGSSALSHCWIRASYLAAAVFSASGHVYVLVSTVSSSDPAWSMAAMYVPFVRTGGAGDAEKLLRGPWLFLQFDLIIIALASLSWVYLLLCDLVGGQKLSGSRLVLALLTSLVLLGPGATVSLALFWREGLLEQLRKETRVDGVDGEKKGTS